MLIVGNHYLLAIAELLDVDVRELLHVEKDKSK